MILVFANLFIESRSKATTNSLVKTLKPKIYQQEIFESHATKSVPKNRINRPSGVCL